MPNKNKNNWFNDNPKKTGFFLFLTAIAIIEITIRILVSFNVVPYQRYPTAEKPVFWDDIDPVVGVWRYPNKTFRHKSSCFDVTYQSNSHGARDPERSYKSNAARRVVVLGDSYVEGFGIKRGKRFTDILEQETGVEFLNFGVSGSFGTIQEWLLYESLALKFDHSDVMIFILPANDFSDNNPKDFPVERFRPYLKRNKSDYELYYTVDFNNRKREFRDWGLTIKNSIDNASYLANFLRFANREIKKGMAQGNSPETNRAEPVPYNSYSQEELEIMLHSLKKIAALAKDRSFYIFTIPGSQDFSWGKENGNSFKITKELKGFAESQANIYFQDLFPEFLKYAQENNLIYDDFTHTCDAHWNELGHTIASKAVKKAASLEK